MKYLFKKNKNAHLHNKGFTLVETLVSIFILTIAITASMGAIQSSLQGSQYAKDQITAYYLGIEAMELVQYIRTTNFITPGAYWLEGLEQCLTENLSGSVCRANPKIGAAGTDGVLEICSGSSCTLKLDSTGAAGAYYQYSSGADSKYTRTITLKRQTTGPGNLIGTSISGSDSVLVTVTVTWSSGRFSNQKVVLQEELYNWH